MDFQAAIIHVVIPILLFFLTVTVGIVGFLLRNKIRDIEKNVEAALRIERDLMEFKAMLPRQFVMKDDYIRTISVFEKKLDDMKDILLEKRNNVSEP